ncbi:MAG: hypothetical protein Q9P90_06930 [candidate division KSB1 bacterium]|nr:hypothetical protein [candidate division KSB1 bacterium]
MNGFPTRIDSCSGLVLSGHSPDGNTRLRAGPAQTSPGRNPTGGGPATGTEKFRQKSIASPWRQEILRASAVAGTRDAEFNRFGPKPMRKRRNKKESLIAFLLYDSLLQIGFESGYRIWHDGPRNRMNGSGN